MTRKAMNEQRISELQSKFKWFNICVTRVPKKGGREKNRQKKHLKILAKIFPNWMKAISPQMQKAKEPQVQKHKIRQHK